MGWLIGSLRDGVWEAAVDVLLQIWEWNSGIDPIGAEGAVRSAGSLLAGLNS